MNMQDIKNIAIAINKIKWDLSDYTCGCCGHSDVLYVDGLLDELSKLFQSNPDFNYDDFLSIVDGKN